jgi:hypothetical protein
LYNIAYPYLCGSELGGLSYLPNFLAVFKKTGMDVWIGPWAPREYFTPDGLAVPMGNKGL